MATQKMATEEAWRVLGLAPYPTAHAIKAAYRRLAKSTHPDATGGVSMLPSAFARVTGAYDVALAEAIEAGRSTTTKRQATRVSPKPTARRPAATPARPGGYEASPSARPGSTTYDGVIQEDVVWDGAAWVGADSGTYWTVNPREYADPRKHGPEYRARGRRPVRKAPREQAAAQSSGRSASSNARSPEQVAALRAVTLRLGAAFALGGTALILSGPLRIAAAVGALLLFGAAVLRWRPR